MRAWRELALKGGVLYGSAIGDEHEIILLWVEPSAADSVDVDDYEVSNNSYELDFLRSGLGRITRDPKSESHGVAYKGQSDQARWKTTFLGRQL